MAKAQFDLLKSRRFLPIFLTQFLGAFNDNAFKNALVILLTYKIGFDSGMDTGILITAAAGIFILPFFLFSAIAGRLADVLDKAFLTRIIKMVEIVLMLAAVIGFYTSNIFLLMCILFLMGTHSAFFGPIKYAILPDYLKQDELIGGNALVEAGTFLAILSGTIFGGILVLQESGLEKISGLVVGAAVAGYISSRFMAPTSTQRDRIQVKWNIFSETMEILRFVSADKKTFLPILGISWFWLLGFTFLAQFPLYVRDILRADETVVTLFLSVFSIGIAFGSLLCNRLLRGRISALYVPLGAWGMTAAISLFCFFSPSGLDHQELIGISEFLPDIGNIFILASLLAIAVFGGIYIVPLYALMQMNSPTGHRSRTVAANNILNALFMVLASVAVVLLLKAGLSVIGIFLLLAALNIPVALYARRLAA